MSSFGQPLEAPKIDRKHETKLSTQSPEALKVAAEITPTRLANLLIRKGPLAIRLITAQLSIEVPGFELLSLSKQRRLIMAAMEQEDPTNNVVFEKIGWGQWAVRRTGSDYIVTDNTSGYPRVSVQELREKAKLGWLKKADAEKRVRTTVIASEYADDADSINVAIRAQKRSSRRDSITNSKKNLHNTWLPNEKLDHSGALLNSELDSELSDDDQVMDDMETDEALTNDPKNAILRADLAHTRLADVDDNAIAEDSDEDSDDEDDDDDEQEYEDPLFKFDDDEYASAARKPRFKKSPPLEFANRVPTKFSPPPALSGSRRKLSSATVNAVSKNTAFSNSSRQNFFSRSRLNSLENLDNYIISLARGLAVSISSPIPQTNSVTSSSPIGSWSSKNDLQFPHELHMAAEHFAAAFGRRKLSFNESNIRSTLATSLPRGQVGGRVNENGSHVNLPSLLATVATEHKTAHSGDDGASETDEEDWAVMGAETLRSHSTGLRSPADNGLKNEERTAARALVDLMGT